MMNALIDYYRTRKISFYSYLGIAAAVCASKAGPRPVSNPKCHTSAPP